MHGRKKYVCSELSTSISDKWFEFNQEQPELACQAGKKAPTRILIMLQPKQAGLGVFLVCGEREGTASIALKQTEMRKLKVNVLMTEL